MTNHEDEGVSISESSPVPGVLVAAEIDGERKYVIVGQAAGRLLDRQLTADQARAVGNALLEAADVIDASS